MSPELDPLVNQESERIQVAVEEERQRILAFIELLINGNYGQTLDMDGPIADALNKLLKKLKTESLREMDRAVNISVRVNETTIFSAGMLSELRSVNDQVQSIATAAEEMVTSIEIIRNNGERIAIQSADTTKATANGANSVRLAISGMQSIKESVDNTVKHVRVLENFSKDIGKIADKISLIAFQNKLLALNATIEAARAGEAGRSFAVVATEVKRLSESTDSASNDIEKLVKQLQEEMSGILTAMKENENAVEHGQNALRQVEESMHLIQEKAGDVNSSTKEIATILNEQKNASEEIASGINSISVNTDHNVESIESIVDSMNEAEKLVSGHIAELAKIEVHGKIVKLAKSDHVLWKKRLANMIAGREGLKTDELADHHSCRLGKWYDKVEDPSMKNNPIFIKLAEPHRKVHAHGLQAVEFYNNNRLSEALKEIEAVELASRDVLSLLDALDSYKST
ncbi:MAG: CZB domain-containing protein [Leptospiraceae bacterium]|nr:CZB domain-containing protein [Leptospiraceae bacterium]